MLLGISGVSLLGSVWGAVSAVSTVGPAMGEIGAYGRLEGLDWPSRLALVPLMMGGPDVDPAAFWPASVSCCAGTGWLSVNPVSGSGWPAAAAGLARTPGTAMARYRDPAAPDLDRDLLRGRIRSTTLRVIGIGLAAVSVGMLACALLEALTSRRDTAALAVSALLAGAAGGLLGYVTRPGVIRKRHIFATVAWTWILITGVGALPFILGGTFAHGGAGFVEQVVNSLFESASGFSASGSTVLADFEAPGRGLMMYRQLTHWYGGMGVVVLAVAVLPFLGVGGLELISAEAPGPVIGPSHPEGERNGQAAVDRLHRLHRLCGGGPVRGGRLLVGLRRGGPRAHARLHRRLLPIPGLDRPPTAAWRWRPVVIVFMILGGTSFSLHWRAVANRTLPYHSNSEFRSYLFVLGLAATVIVILLWLKNGLPLGSSIRAATFTVVSLGTSTGLTNATGPGSPADYVIWVAGAQLVLLFLMVVGGCTGSTSGGIKVMRMQVLGAGVMLRSVQHSQTPRAVIPIRLGRETVSESVVSRVAGFFLLHFLLVIGGPDRRHRAGGRSGDVAGERWCRPLGNMGPALGEAGPTSKLRGSAFSQPARLVLALLMIIGRLEILPILLAVVPHVYRVKALTRVIRR